MKRNSFGIADGGAQRLRAAIAASVRRKYEAELSAATDEAQRTALEEKIKREIKAELKRVASPYSLWGAQ